jgi:hypothetical protein
MSDICFYAVLQLSEFGVLYQRGGVLLEIGTRAEDPLMLIWLGCPFTRYVYSQPLFSMHIFCMEHGGKGRLWKAS